MNQRDVEEFQAILVGLVAQIADLNKTLKSMAPKAEPYMPEYIKQEIREKAALNVSFDQVGDYLNDQVRQYGSHLQRPTITSDVHPIVYYTRECICKEPWPRCARTGLDSYLIHSVECDEANQ